MFVKVWLYQILNLRRPVVSGVSGSSGCEQTATLAPLDLATRSFFSDWSGLSEYFVHNAAWSSVSYAGMKHLHGRGARLLRPADRDESVPGQGPSTGHYHSTARTQPRINFTAEQKQKQQVQKPEQKTVEGQQVHIDRVMD